MRTLLVLLLALPAAADPCLLWGPRQLFQWEPPADLELDVDHYRVRWAGTEEIIAKPQEPRAWVDCPPCSEVRIEVQAVDREGGAWYWAQGEPHVCMHWEVTGGRAFAECFLPNFVTGLRSCWERQ